MNEEKRFTLKDLEEKRYFTIKEIEEQGIGDRITQYRWREQGKLSYFKLGTRILYSRQHIEDFLARHEKQAKTEKRSRQAA